MFLARGFDSKLRESGRSFDAAAMAVGVVFSRAGEKNFTVV